MVKEIPLQNGMVAFVDDEDFERCMEHLWTVGSTSNNAGLQVRNVTLGLLLQQFVLNERKEEGIITFVNKNQLDFCKENLLITDWKGVSIRKKGWRNATSNYKGVSWNKQCNKWSAQITVNRKKKHLGLFEIEDDAAEEYNKAAKTHFGENSYQNLIGEDNSPYTHQLDKAVLKFRAKVHT